MAGKYKAYPDYKDSGKEWLGEIPLHWTVKPIKLLLTTDKGAIKTGPFGSHLKNDDMNGEYAKVINQRNVLDQDFSSGDYYVNEDKYHLLSGFKVFPGDILITTRGTIGRTAIAPSTIEVSILHPCLMRLQIDDRRCDRKLLALQIQDSGYFLEQLKVLSNATTIEVIYSDTLKNVLVALPPSLEEQVQIKRFLDYETTKINQLIAKQERLIDLLKEKRQAVISQAVTKGLNTDVKMKDRGVEWLGEVPEHWNTCAVRRVVVCIEQGTSPLASNYPPGNCERGVLKISSVKKGKFFELESKTLDTETPFEERFAVHKGDLLMTRANTPALVADVCVVDEEPVSPLMMCDLIYRLKINRQVSGRFLSYWFLSDKGRLQIQLDARGSSMSMAKVSQEHIKMWLITLPPINEQIEISDYLEAQEMKFEKLIGQAGEVIELLKERRTALISAAVTGKIDVRDWHLPADKGRHEQPEAVTI